MSIPFVLSGLTAAVNFFAYGCYGGAFNFYAGAIAFVAMFLFYRNKKKD